MGMVNNSADSLMRSGNAYGAYANAPTPFGPWAFQESRKLLQSHFALADDSETRVNLKYDGV